jgi:hypothetical protein
MSGHFVAVVKKMFLWSDHRPIDADAQLRTYIRWYEAVARTAWFVGACLFALGLGSMGDLISQAKEAARAIIARPGEFGTVMSGVAASAFPIVEAIILGGVTVVWHHTYLKHVKNETMIISSCFEPDQKPAWDEVSGAKYAPFIAAWLFIAFSGLCLLIENIKWFALIAILLNLGDFVGNEFTKNNLLREFRSKEFGTKNRVLLARRRIALEYWNEKLQFSRILAMFMANVLALTLSTSPFGIHIPDLFSYVVVIAAILANEYIINSWRLERDGKLAKFPIANSPAAGTDTVTEQTSVRPGQTLKRKRSPPQADGDK